MLSGEARSWFRMMRSELTSWRRFVLAFRDQYSVELLDRDILAELQSRTQGKGEPVAQYIACFRGIVNYFDNPPPQRQLVDMALTQLRPEYRRFMVDKSLSSLNDIVREGKRYERQLSLDEKFTNPPPKEKALIRAATSSGAQYKAAKVSAAATVEQAPAARKKAAKKNAGKKETKKRMRRRRRRRRGEGRARSSATRRLLYP